MWGTAGRSQTTYEQENDVKEGAAVRIGGILAAALGGAALYTRIATKRIEQEVPIDGDFVDVPGARLHYVDRGTGQTIVMLHGMGAQLRNYAYGVADALAADFRVILVDRPGSGYSTPTGDQLGILDQAATVAALIEHLKLARPLLVGHSLAGAIALGVATHHPDTIGGLALLAPMTQPPHMMPTPLAGAIKGARVGRALFANLLGTPLSRAAYGLRWRTIFAPDPVPEDFATRGGGALGDRPISMNAATVELASADEDIAAIVARYGALNLPVALLYGREDQVIDPSVDGERAVAAIPGATLETTDGGHMLPVAHPEATTLFIRAVAGRIAS